MTMISLELKAKKLVPRYKGHTNIIENMNKKPQATQAENQARLRDVLNALMGLLAWLCLPSESPCAVPLTECHSIFNNVLHSILLNVSVPTESRPVTALLTSVPSILFILSCTLK